MKMSAPLGIIIFFVVIVLVISIFKPDSESNLEQQRKRKEVEAWELNKAYGKMLLEKEAGRD